MNTLNSQAVKLNDLIQTHNPTVFDMLSRKGKGIYYPWKGILAQGGRAKGKEINATLGTAYEDDGSPMVLPSILKKINIDSKCAFPYAPSEGVASLRERWRDLIRMKNPSLGTKPISLPVVTSALTHGLSMVGYLFMDPGDKIIVPDLCWDNYDLVFSNGYDAEIVPFNFFKNDVFDVEAFRNAINKEKVGKKIVLLNFPNNPSGYTPTIEAGKEIIAVLKEAAEKGNNLVVIMDDAYFGLFFEEGICTESLFSELADLHEHLLVVKVDGITKEEYAWGFRVGFITYGIKGGNAELYKALEEKTAGAVRGNISNASHLSQSLFLEGLKGDSYNEEKLRNEKKIGERYIKVKEILKGHEEYKTYFDALPFNSGYFMCIRLKGLDTEKVYEKLLNDYSTGVICFSDKNILRIAFAAVSATKLEKLFTNIYNACKDCA